MKPINLKSKKFGRYTVIGYDISSKGKGHARWICKCKCGIKKSVRASHLKDGNVSSCGCYAKSVSKKLLSKYVNSSSFRGKNNHRWKGDNASIGPIHQWLKRHFGRKNICEFCKLKKKTDWALKKGKKYQHKISNFISLCRSCHLKYDYTPSRKNKISQSLKGKIRGSYEK